MKKIKNNKGFALAKILAVTLVLMIIFTVLYSNFMPLSGEYARAESYKDISSQYELHYFRKLFKNSTLESENYKVLINSETNECPTSSDENMCNSLKNELNPTLILTKYNISELKNELKQYINKLSDLRNYILSLPDYIDKNGEDEVYRLIIKTNSGYATTQLDYKTTKIMPNAPVLTSNMIPVYYDATTETWKKADSSNDNSNWYDYDNKIWANAVTVSEANRNTYLNAEVGTEIPMSDINTM